MKSYSKNHFIQSLKVPLFMVSFIFVIHVIKVLTGLNFGLFGIYPREISSLPGIITAPLIHGSFQHLFSNILPLFATSFIVFLFYKRVAIRSIMLIYILTGISVWIGAKPAFHIGASGVVYGLVSFIFWSGVFRRNAKSIALSLIVVIMYSGYIAGILPNQEGISWESHLFGGLVGILVARIYKDEIEKDEITVPYEWEKQEDVKQRFLHHETFQKTKSQREWEQNFEEWTRHNT